MPKLRTIKKYPNRRLYDTELSRYITLADVRELVMQEKDFIVIDTNSKEDLTRSILLQIIIEQESGGDPMFSADILSKMIRFYGDSVQGVFSSFLEKSLGLFIEQQARLQKQIREMMTTTPVGTMADITKQNLEIWQEMQENFLKAYGYNPATKQFEPKKFSDEK